MKPSERSAPRAVNKLSNKIRRRIEAQTAHSGLSGAQGRALHFILAQPGEVFQKDIEEEYGLRPSTASELLKKMEKAGLIRREPVDYDARLKRIVPTEAARARRQQIVEGLARLDAEAVAGIPEEELNTFYAVIDKISQNLG